MPFEDYAHLILDSLDYTGGFLVYKDGSLVKHHGIASRLKATVDLSNQDNIDAIKKRGMVHAYLDGNMLMVYNSNRIMNNEEFSRVADNILKTSNK